MIRQLEGSGGGFKRVSRARGGCGEGEGFWGEEKGSWKMKMDNAKEELRFYVR